VIEQDGDITIEWLHQIPGPNSVLCITKTRFGFVIFDDATRLHIAHVAMPKWWPTERQLEVAQNLVSLIELRSNT
jgi:hypothetical protein